MSKQKDSAEAIVKRLERAWYSPKSDKYDPSILLHALAMRARRYLASKRKQKEGER